MLFRYLPVQYSDRSRFLTEDTPERALQSDQKTRKFFWTEYAPDFFARNTPK